MDNCASATSTTELSMVILAGGFGTRIRHLLGDMPKPMYPVLGRPFLYWVLRYFVRQGLRRFVLSTGYRAELIEQYFATTPVRGATVVCVRETKPLGTAGGFLNAVAGSGFTPSTWLVANGDSLVLGGVAEMLAKPLSVDRGGSLLGLAVPDAARFGTLETTADGRLLRFAEKRPGAGLINAGVYAFRADLLAGFPAKRPLSFEIEVFPLLLQQGCHLTVTTCHAPFIDIGTETSLPQTEAFIRDHHAAF